MSLCEVKSTPEKGGRGVFATRDIKEGEKIYRNGSFAQFFSPDGSAIVETSSDGQGILKEEYNLHLPTKKKIKDVLYLLKSIYGRKELHPRSSEARNAYFDPLSPKAEEELKVWTSMSAFAGSDLEDTSVFLPLAVCALKKVLNSFTCVLKSSEHKTEVDQISRMLKTERLLQIEVQVMPDGDIHYLNHSQQPNCSYHFEFRYDSSSGTMGVTMAVKALCGIEKGKELLINYTKSEEEFTQTYLPFSKAP